MLDLSGRVALVTGSSRGIGRAIAIRLAQAGAIVAVNYRESKGEAAQTLDAILRAGGAAGAYQANITRPHEVEAMLDDVRRDLGAPSILVNNAGINRDRTFKNLDLAQWQDVIEANLTGAFVTTRALIPDLVQSGRGRIVNVASIVGQAGNFGQSNYAASKAGLIGFTKTLALELARDGVTVNAVAPGFIETDMLATVPPPARERLVARIPMARFGTPEEVADAVAFLASDRAQYVTGAVLQVNGGMYM